MYMSKAKREALSNMILAHRVAIRKHQQAETMSDEWLKAGVAETVTHYALEIALGTEEDYMRTTLRQYADEHNDEDAIVAIIRLKHMGAW